MWLSATRPHDLKRACDESLSLLVFWAGSPYPKRSGHMILPDVTFTAPASITNKSSRRVSCSWGLSLPRTYTTANLQVLPRFLSFL